MMITENQVQVNGLNVHYYEAGDPENGTLLLLHGYLGDAWLHWEEALNGLQDEYHIIAPDLPGYGQSDKLRRITVDRLVKWCIDLLDALKVDGAAVIGTSFGGGLVARLLAAHHPSRIVAAVLVNGGVIPAVPGCARGLAMTPVVGWILYNRLAASQTARGGLGGLFEDESFLTDAFVARVRAQRGAVARYMRAFTLMPSPEKRNPPLPVLLLWGEEDAISPRIIAEGMRDHLPGSRLELIAGTRHMPHVEAPDVFVWQVKQFLTGLSRK